MNTLQARVYWALIGVLLGPGMIVPAGILLVPLAFMLLLYAAVKKMMPSDSLLLWIALASMGFAPALLLTLGYIVSDHTTSGNWFGVLLFAAIGLAGIVGGAITTLRRQPR